MNLNKLTLLKVHPVCLHSSIIVPWLLKIMRQLFVLILWNILCIHKFFSLILTVHDKSEACGIFIQHLFTKNYWNIDHFAGRILPYYFYPLKEKNVHTKKLQNQECFLHYQFMTTWYFLLKNLHRPWKTIKQCIQRRRIVLCLAIFLN